MVDPASLPIYLWLHCCKPWIAENGFVLSEVGEEELEGYRGRSCSDVENGIVAEVSASVFCPVDIKQFTGFRELLNGEF